jgi:hypothetical protein
MIFDTGASVSLISESFYQQLLSMKIINPIGPLTAPTVHAANSTPMAIKGTIEAIFEIGGVSVFGTACVASSLPYPCLIGNDLADVLAPIINFQDRTLTPRGGKPVLFTTIASVPSYKSHVVRLVKAVELAPRTLNIVLAHVPVTAVGARGLAEPNSFYRSWRSGLAMAPCHVEVGDAGVIPVQLANFTDKPVKIRSRAVLGSFATLEQLDGDIVSVIDEQDPVPPSVTETSLPPGLTLDTPDALVLTAEQRQRLLALLAKNSDRFASSSSVLGSTAPIKLHIPTTVPHPPQRPAFRRLSPVRAAEIARQVREYLASGVVRPSVSPWASPVVLIRKKDGKWRFCVDYSQLNAFTIRDVYPLP